MKELPKIIAESLYTNKEKPWLWKLYVPVSIKLTNGEVIVVPKGYVTDFTSAPKKKMLFVFVRAFVYQTGRQNLGVLVHDWLYDQRHHKGRKWADKEMLHWLLESGCTKFKAYTMYYAVSIAGKSWWST